MKYLLLLFSTVLTKDYLYLKRYWFNTLFSICFLCVVFFIVSFLFDEFKKIDQIESSLNLLSGYIVWIYMTVSFSTSITNITNEATLGTLEQLYINSRFFYLTLLMQAISALTIIFIQITILIVVIVILGGYSYQFLISYLMAMPILLVGLPSIWGLSFMLSSLVLRYKNATSIYTTVSSILFGIINYIAFDNHSWEISFIPFGLASSCIQAILRGGNPLSWEIIGVILISSLCYFTIGLLIFRKYERVSKKKAIFGHH